MKYQLSYTITRSVFRCLDLKTKPSNEEMLAVADKVDSEEELIGLVCSKFGAVHDGDPQESSLLKVHTFKPYSYRSMTQGNVTVELRRVAGSEFQVWAIVDGEEQKLGPSIFGEHIAEERFNGACSMIRYLVKK